MSILRRRKPGQPTWSSELVRALGGQAGTTGEPAILRSLGQFVPLTPDRTSYGPVARGDDRGDVVLAWTRSGDLTYGEAEQLVALDESTPWFKPV